MESEDSWANESMESGGSKNYSDGDDDRNASVFSENGVNEEHDEVRWGGHLWRL